MVCVGTHEVKPAGDLRTKILNGGIALEPERDALRGTMRVQKVDEHLGIVAIAFCGRDPEDFGIESVLSCNGPDEFTEFFKIQCHD